MSIHNILLTVSGALLVLSGCTQTSCPCCTPRRPPEDPSQYATLAKLRPKAQKALDKVLAKGLVKDPQITPKDDISEYLYESSMETKYVMYTLTGFLCELDNGHSIINIAILPNLCSDLDAILRTDTPSPEDLDHAIWMASILKLRNVVSFLKYMGAPAGKYKIGKI